MTKAELIDAIVDDLKTILSLDEEDAAESETVDTSETDETGGNSAEEGAESSGTLDEAGAVTYTTTSDSAGTDETTTGTLTVSQNEAILRKNVENAYREVRLARNYQKSHTADFIDSDMEQFRGNIQALALYDYNQNGAEGQTSHSENSISRTWKTRSDCFNGVYPFAGLI